MQQHRGGVLLQKMIFIKIMFIVCKFYVVLDKPVFDCLLEGKIIIIYSNFLLIFNCSYSFDSCFCIAKVPREYSIINLR